MSVSVKLIMMIAGQLSDKEKRNQFAIIILALVCLVLLFMSVFVFKSDHPKDVYLQAAREVAIEQKAVNRIDGNLIRSIYFLYEDKRTEDIDEIKQFINDFFVRRLSEVVMTENGPVLVTYSAFKSYMEIQAMLLLPPFEYTVEEMILVNLYLMTAPNEDFGDEFPDWGGDDDNTGGGIPGGGINPDEGTAGRPDVLPFRLQSPCSGAITSYFGVRTHPVTGEQLSMHTGIDIAGAHHQPIAAVADGVVVQTNTAQSGYGNYIKLKHTIEGITFYTFYAHLNNLTVTNGQTVYAGQMIGAEGGGANDNNPGTSTGHHLHFEIRLSSDRGSCIDPAPYI